MSPPLRTVCRPPALVAACLAALIAGAQSTRGGGTPFIAVFNQRPDGAEESMRGWRHPFTRRFLLEWGAARGLDLVEDRGPVTDDTASFVAPGGSSVRVCGLRRGGRYRIWIDFVAYRGQRSENFSTLIMYATGPGGGRWAMASLAAGDIGNSYFSAEIPIEATARGCADVIFEERARVPGDWGVWDIIVTEGNDLPEINGLRDEGTVDLEIKDRMVQ